MRTRFSFALALSLVLGLALAGASGCSMLSHASSAKTAAKPVRIVKLPSTIVNLAGAGDSSYLRISVSLSLESPTPKAGSAGEQLQSMARDTLINTASTQTAAALLAPGGRAQFKKALLTALRKRLPRAQINAVYLDDFLVQQ